MRFTEQFLDPWEELRYVRREDAFIVGDRLLDPSRWEARGRATGLEGTFDFWVCFSFEGEKISRADFFMHRDDAVEWAQKLGGAT